MNDFWLRMIRMTSQGANTASSRRNATTGSISGLNSPTSSDITILVRLPRPLPATAIWEPRDAVFFRLVWLHHRKLRLQPAPSLDYNAIVEHLAALFGEERVHVLLYEGLLASPDGFVSTLCTILGVDVDAGLQMTLGPRKNQTSYSGGPVLQLAYD